MHIYLCGICGTGMSALANLLLEAGYKVSGSDAAFYPPVGDFLKTLPITLYEGYSEDNLRQAEPDMVVVGNALSRGNVEVEYLLNSSVPFISMAGALKRFFLSDRKRIVVTGTHGKTTTTSLMAHMLNATGPGTSFWVGGIPLNFNKPSFYNNQADWFVVEGDEYDSAFFEKYPKFHHYMPHILILNNLEFDHADIYNSLNDILQQFKYLLRWVPSRGKIIANADDSNVREVLKESHSNVITYGMNNDADYTFSIVNNSEFRFILEHQNTPVLSAPMNFPLEGLAYNMAAVAIAALQLNMSPDSIVSGFNSFKGVKRRLETIFDVNDVLVLDDFAHHPTAVKITVEAVKKKFPDRRVVAIFEPRSNTSVRSIFQKEYESALSTADTVVLAPVFSKKSGSTDKLDVSKIISEIKKSGKEGFTAPNHKELLSYITSQPLSNSVFLLMSNGDFEPFKSQFIQYLKQRVS